MIPMSAMKYYLDPTIPAAGDTEYAYVIADQYDRPSTAAMVGTFIKPRKTPVLLEHKLLATTDEGYHLYAVPANRTRHDGGWHVGLLDSPDAPHTRFVVGAFDRMQTEDTMRLYRVRFSDTTGTATPVPLTPGSIGMRVPVRTWMKAAPWAEALMPEPGDTPEIIDLKLASAREQWTQTYRLMRLEAEGRDRDWDGDLRRLREDNDWLPKFSYGHFVDAVVNVGEKRISDPVPQSLQDRVAALSGGGLPVRPLVQQVTVSVPVRASVAIPYNPRPWNESDSVSRELVQARVREVLGSEGDLEVANYTSERFICGMAADD